VTRGDLRSGAQSAAAFVKEQGWVVGSILQGGPITSNGRPIESARRVRITAIGEENVLGRADLSSYGPGEGRESSLSFDCRDWILATDALAPGGWCDHYAPPGACSFCPELPTPASHPPSPATGADNCTTTHTTPDGGAGDEGESHDRN
jgi:hypothetical protein